MVKNSKASSRKLKSKSKRKPKAKPSKNKLTLHKNKLAKKAKLGTIVSKPILNQLNEIIKTQSRLAMANFNMNTFMNLVVEQMQELTSATGVVIELVSGNEMVYRAATGSVADHIGLRLPIATSISGLCVKSRKILRCNDTEKDERVNVEACRRVNARSLVVTPLFHEGEAVGVLKILADKVNAFNENDVQTLQLMAGFLGTALAHQIYYETTQRLLHERAQHVIELQKAQVRLKHLAEHDYLTSLANRSLFIERLRAAISNSKNSGQLNALFAFDIDYFKSVNDTLGHTVGDALLKAFTLRVKRIISGNDLFARIGGDEFVLLVENIQHPDNAQQLAKRINQTISDAFKIQQHIVKITTSIGITLFGDGHLSDEELLKQADLALYAAKAAGRNTYRVFKIKEHSL